MIVRKRRRIEIRIDEERGEFLDREAARRGITLAELLREWIDAEREREARQRRLAAVRRLGSLQLDVPEDPAELRQLLIEEDLPIVKDLDCPASS